MSSETQAGDQQQPACPVDHKSREAWVSQARAASEPAPMPPDHPPIPRGGNPNTAVGGGDGSAESCPVDHKAREVWLQQARAVGATPSPPATATSKNHTSNTSSSWSSWTAYLPSFWASAGDHGSRSATQSNDPRDPASLLGTDREVSSIPRTATSSYPASYSAQASQPLSNNPASSSLAPANPPAAQPASHGAPANNEQETGADAATGNWIYPSERMFFEAMRRKGYVDGGDGGEGKEDGGATTQAARQAAADMRAVVPIHNAVNERAWAEIKAWEAPWIARLNAQRAQQQQQNASNERRAAGGGPGTCDGPRLHSFAGLSDRPTPRARLNTLLGYQAPFDRHDWVVDRCGVRVEYVIDFYAGRGAAANGGGGAGGGSGGGPGKPLSFYLDVRPKLNSWEGVKMRACKALGLI